MEQEIIIQLHGNFEKNVQKDTETGIEFWFARDLQILLGYSKWENFVKVIEKARTACKTAEYEVADHFVDVNKMVELGSRCGKIKVRGTFFNIRKLLWRKRKNKDDLNWFVGVFCRFARKKQEQ
jgi:hypothetical protein